MVYFAFDLLYLDGFDLRKAPLIERKRVLAVLLEEAKSDCFHLAQHLEVAPVLAFEQACAMDLEGIVCKLRDAPYRSGDRASWTKIKCVKRGVFPIVGLIAAPGAIAALHLARREGKALQARADAGWRVGKLLAGDRPRAGMFRGARASLYALIGTGFVRTGLTVMVQELPESPRRPGVELGRRVDTSG